MVGYVVSLSRTISRREFQAAGSSSSCLRGGRGWGGRGRRRSRRTMVVCTVKGRLEGEEEKEEENRLEAGGGTEDRTSPWKIILTVAPFIISTIIGLLLITAGITSKKSTLLTDLATQFGQRNAAILLFIVTFIGTMIPLGSTSNFATASGFLFGRLRGFLIVYSAKYLASMFIFGLGRTTLRSFVRTKLKSYPSADKLLTAAEQEGWPVMVALRLSPVPTVFVNYIFSIANVNGFLYAIATAIAMGPFVFSAVCLGSAARQISTVTAEGTNWVEIGLSTVLALFLAYVASKVNSRVKKITREEDEKHDTMKTEAVKLEV